MNGKIRKFDLKKGFGFIKGEDGSDYFFHYSALRGAKMEELQEGQECTFEETEGPKGLRAEEVYLA
jgi:CspA family cold shock protein